MTGSRARAAPRAGPGSVTGTAPRAPTGSGRSWGKSLPLRSGESPEGMGRAPLSRGRAGCARVLRRLLRSFTLYYAPFNRAAGLSCRGGGQSPPLAGARRGGMPARWCGWGSWDDSGRAVVQICCKGAPGRDRPRMKARNINDSLSALRRDGGLCNRFGQTAPPRAPGRSAAGRAALSWSVSARSRPARRGTRRHHRINSLGRRTTRTTTPTPHRNTPGVPARKTHHAPWERTITTSLPRKSEQTPAE